MTISLVAIVIQARHTTFRQIALLAPAFIFDKTAVLVTVVMLTVWVSLAVFVGAKVFVCFVSLQDIIVSWLLPEVMLLHPVPVLVLCLTMHCSISQ